MVSLLGQVKEILLRLINGAHDQEVNMEARRLLGSEEFSEDLLGVMFHSPPPFTSNIHTCKLSGYETRCACLWQTLYRLSVTLSQNPNPRGHYLNHWKHF